MEFFKKVGKAIVNVNPITSAGKLLSGDSPKKIISEGFQSVADVAGINSAKPSAPSMPEFRATPAVERNVKPKEEAPIKTTNYSKILGVFAVVVFLGGLFYLIKNR
jgi:hypothetical protein